MGRDDRGPRSTGVRHVRHAAIELVPAGPDVLELHVPHRARPVVATRYLAGLLAQFEAPAQIDDVLARYPFERDAARTFLDACVRAGVLVDARDGAAHEPDTIEPRRTLFGAPAFDPAAPAAFTIVGVPWDGATTGQPGARHGPASIRAAAEGLRYTVDPATMSPAGFHDYAAGARRLAHVTLADAGDVRVAPGEGLRELGARIERVLGRVLGAGSIPIVLGGDHSITVATLRALPVMPLQILHLDAHTDLGDLQRGEVHHGNVFSAVLEGMPNVERVVQVGLRGLVAGAQHSDEARVEMIGMHQVRASTPDVIAARLDPNVACWISLDIDVVDPAFAPATGTPVPGGLFPHELDALLAACTRRCPVVGVEVVEVGEDTLAGSPTAQLALALLVAAADGIVQRSMAEPETELATAPRTGAPTEEDR